MELLLDGKLVPYRMLRVLSTYSDLGLRFVGLQHMYNYTCRYTSWWPEPLHSELRNPSYWRTWLPERWLGFAS